MAVIGPTEGPGSDARNHDRGAARLALAVLGRPLRVLFLGIAVLAVVGAATALSLPMWLRYVPLALSVVVFGLPHGAVDHLVPARLRDGGRWGTSTRRSAAAVGVLYLLLGGAYVLVWLAAPRLAALAFIGMTWFHWGQGDLWVLVGLLDAEHLRSRLLRGATVVVRGGLPMLVPLLAFPDRYRAVVSAWTALFNVEFGLPWLFAPRTRAALGAGFALVTVGTLAAGRLRVAGQSNGDDSGPRRAWRIDAAEVGVLWAYFALVPPLVAVGLYFTCWHALRHIARLVLLDPENEVPGTPPSLTAWAAGAVARFARDAAPLTALSVVLLVGFGAVVPATARTVPEYGALYLVFISVVTLPHVVVVGMMDRADGVWAAEAPGAGTEVA